MRLHHKTLLFKPCVAAVFHNCRVVKALISIRMSRILCVREEVQHIYTFYRTLRGKIKQHLKSNHLSSLTLNLTVRALGGVMQLTKYHNTATYEYTAAVTVSWNQVEKKKHHITSNVHTHTRKYYTSCAQTPYQRNATRNAQVLSKPTVHQHNTKQHKQHLLWPYTYYHS